MIVTLRIIRSEAIAKDATISRDFNARFPEISVFDSKSVTEFRTDIYLIFQ
jgi:hypothetical protein